MTVPLPRIRQMTHARGVVACLATAWAVAACDVSSSVRPPVTPALRGPPLPSPSRITTVSPALLTGDALAALGPDGRFTRSVTPIPRPPYAMVSAADATTAANAFLRVWAYGDWFYEADRGGPIGWSRLAPCGPPQFAEYSVESPGDTIDSGTRTAWSPRWIVVFCDGATDELVVSLSAIGADLIHDDTLPLPPGGSSVLSAAWSAHGIPVGVRYPRDAEEAATRVAMATGRRVDSIPRLVVAFPPFSPWWTLWNVSVEGAPVQIVGDSTGRVRSRHALWYGMIPHFRWIHSLADPIASADEGPFNTDARRLLPGGAQQSVRLSFARVAAPAFGVSESVTVVPP